MAEIPRKYNGEKKKITDELPNNKILLMNTW